MARKRREHALWRRPTNERQIGQLTGSQRQQSAEWACKPGSVVNGHLSCLHVTVQLHARYPNADRAGPWRSYSRLLRMGLAKPPCYHDAGGLLHHRFSFSLYALRRRWESSFLRRFPSDHSARPLAGIPPSGARTFLTRAASSTSRNRLAHSAVQECSTPLTQAMAQHKRSTR